MIAKEKALKELSKYGEKYRPSYSIIDPLIKPLCDLLTENEYITMHSCSSHVKIKKFKAVMILNPAISCHMTDKEKQEWMTSSYKQWYVLFVATVPITDIQKVVKIVNDKYNYNVTCKKAESHGGITRRWVIETFIDVNSNDDDIYELNKNIYLEFKDYFDKK